MAMLFDFGQGSSRFYFQEFSRITFKDDSSYPIWITLFSPSFVKFLEWSLQTKMFAIEPTKCVVFIYLMGLDFPRILSYPLSP